MQSVSRRCAGMLVALVLAGTAAQALAWTPKFPAPPRCTVGRLGDSMTFNGIDMEIRQLRCPGSVEDILEFYRQRWPKGTEKEPGYTTSDELTPWQILTRVEHEHLMTVQVTAEGRDLVVGYLAMSKLPDPDDLPAIGRGFPALHDSVVYNDIESEDPGKKGRTLQLSNDKSKESNVIFYRNWYKDRGWTVLMDKPLGDRMHTFTFKNGAESVNLIVVQGEGKAVVTAQVVNEGWW